ncbi:MAG: hypothetical protein ABIH23_16920 [bacterium]
MKKINRAVDQTMEKWNTVLSNRMHDSFESYPKCGFCTYYHNPEAGWGECGGCPIAKTEDDWCYGECTGIERASLDIPGILAIMIYVEGFRV